MQTDVINIALAFLEGFALIISPCILPILPIILSGSLTGSKARPLGIISGFIITFTIVTLFSKLLIDAAHLDPNIIRNISFGILFLLGLVMLSTYLTEKFNVFAQRLAQVGSNLKGVNNPQGGFVGGLLFGGLIGIIWTPCAGPILAAVIVQTIIQQTSLNSLLTVIAFAIGAGLPMLLIALLGRSLVDHFGFIKKNMIWFRKILGLIIIASVIYLAFGTSFSLSTEKSSGSSIQGTTLINGLSFPYPSPEITGIDAWINSPPLQISALKGKVVLIDFWTYSCINCIRTFPYLKKWYADYHDKGLVIIGVHSPEFQFEHNIDNVKAAVKKFGILYPVALDNQFKTWNQFNNQYWPAHFLINKDGMVVYVHFGEGEYDTTENNIRYLLGMAATNVKSKAIASAALNQTPETYLGYDRSTNFSNLDIPLKNKLNLYHYPLILPLNSWALKGKWTIYTDRIVAEESGAAIKLHFSARKVYAVMGAQLPTRVNVLLNARPVAKMKGDDVVDNQVNVSRNQLYSLLNLAQSDEGILELTAANAGLEIYTFTFG